MKAPKSDRDVERLQRELNQVTKLYSRAKRCMYSVMHNLDIVLELKEAIKKEDLFYAQQIWEDIEFKDQEAMMIAPTKGGVFTTQERAAIGSFWKVSIEDIEGHG